MSHKRSGICIEFHIHNFGSKIVSIRGSRLTLVFMQKELVMSLKDYHIDI